MEPNRRDTLKRRCTTVVWGVALMLAVGIVGVIFYPVFNPSATHIDDQVHAQEEIHLDFKKVHESQEKTKASYNYDINKAAEKLAKEATR